MSGPFRLPAAYKAAIDTARKAANINMQAVYDVKSTATIRSLVGKGMQLRPLPRDVMDAP
jgi:TRAP-type mannitol/chloroaromatic compound transport system substrate-binding protein